SERMIGDIDILVASDQSQKAFQLMTSQGYSKCITFNYKVKNFRHLARQVHEDKLAAIELHKCVLNDEYAHLIDTDSILSTKTIVNGIAVPNKEYLIRTIILAYQINSYGNYYSTIHFKYIYDCLVLNLDSNKTMLKKLSEEQYTAKFLVLGNVHFSEIEVFNNSFAMSITRAQYVFSLKHRPVGKTVYHIKNGYQKIRERLHLMIFNKSYRKHILSNKIFRHN
ncbi:nucleotidyltransferase family protein, partial [Oceanihabitans sp.]|nr:nucleotidyltransferase family protein [Oceanihabitans sp.]